MVSFCLTHSWLTEKMARLSIVTSLMSSTSAMPSAQPDRRLWSIVSAAGSPEWYAPVLPGHASRLVACANQWRISFQSLKTWRQQDTAHVVISNLQELIHPSGQPHACDEQTEQTALTCHSQHPNEVHATLQAISNVTDPPAGSWVTAFDPRAAGESERAVGPRNHHSSWASQSGPSGATGSPEEVSKFSPTPYIDSVKMDMCASAPVAASERSRAVLKAFISWLN